MRLWPLFTVMAAGGCAPSVRPPRPSQAPPSGRPRAVPHVPRPVEAPAPDPSPVSPASMAPTAPVQPAPSVLAPWPELSALPRRPLGQFPTPLDPAPELAAAAGLASLSIKRDDLAAEPYGGSKIRKLAWLLGAAEPGKPVHTVGGVGSHHALATAIYAAREGFRPVLHLIPQRPGLDTRTTLFGALQAGAQMHLAGSVPLAQARARAAEATWLPAGGSSPRGNLGYVEAGIELAGQMGERPADAVYVAMGTMGTAVGLAIGLQLAGVPTRVVAVRASNVPTSTRRRVEQLYERTVAFMRAVAPGLPNLRFEDANLDVEGAYLGRGYALPTPEGGAAGRLAAAHGLRLDETYTQKAFAALLAHAKENNGLRAVFWQTHDPAFAAHGRVTDLPPALQSYAR